MLIGKLTSGSPREGGFKNGGGGQRKLKLFKINEQKQNRSLNKNFERNKARTDLEDLRNFMEDYKERASSEQQNFRL